jgi:hypothetical protein
MIRNFERFTISWPNTNILMLLMHVQKLTALCLHQGDISPSILLVGTEENHKRFSKIYCILASCYIRLTLNICSFVRQCNTFTS